MEGKDSFLPLPYPHRFFFGSRAGKIPKTPFLGISLLPNSTETLATQATFLFASCFFICVVLFRLRCAFVYVLFFCLPFAFLSEQAVNCAAGLHSGYVISPACFRL